MEDVQQLKHDFEAIRDERRVHANTAVRIGEALLSLLWLNGDGEDRWLSKEFDDTANGLIRFVEGLLLGDGTYGIDNLGKALLKDVVAEVMKSPDFQLGMSGWAIYRNGDATKLEIDELLVRRLATFFKLEICELAYVAGNIVLLSDTILFKKGWQRFSLPNFFPTLRLTASALSLIYVFSYSFRGRKIVF